MLKKIREKGSLVLVIIFSLTEMAFAASITGKVSTNKVKVPKDILIYIEKIEGKELPPPQQSVKMDQIGLVYVPHVLPVIKGTTVDFHNSDDVKHNTFGVGADDFDLGTWTKGIVRSYTFDKLGETAILCNLHPEMEAYVVVLQNPYFSLTDEEGKYEIKDVPQGEYKLKTWHDRLKAVTEEVSVPASGAVEKDFELSK